MRFGFGRDDTRMKTHAWRNHLHTARSLLFSYTVIQIIEAAKRWEYRRHRGISSALIKRERQEEFLYSAVHDFVIGTSFFGNSSCGRDVSRFGLVASLSSSTIAIIIAATTIDVARAVSIRVCNEQITRYLIMEFFRHCFVRVARKRPEDSRMMIRRIIPR
jgi:hypothetical protein